MIIGGENDVLLERGTKFNNNKGNISFRYAMKCCKESYSYICGIKHVLYLIVMEVQQRIKRLSHPGRFIYYDSNTYTWIKISDKDVQQKISQALRKMYYPRGNLKKMTKKSNVFKSYQRWKVVLYFRCPYSRFNPIT